MNRGLDPAGALTCARYAFAPNLYLYCGPDTNGNLGEYVKAEVGDEGLGAYVAKFETLYPYLQVIAHANGLADPFDPRVVEAYWVGNNLLERVSEQETYLALTEAQLLPKRIPKKELNALLPKIDERARLHHSFHVFNVFTRTGHFAVKQTVESMDECRISWGKVVNAKLQKLNAKQNINNKIPITTQKLIYKEGKLKLVPSMREVMVAQEALGVRLKAGDWVSVHWGFVCDVLNERQVRQLERYTQHHLQLANETI